MSTLERLERAMALFLIVAWRIVHLMRLGRTLQDLDSAELFFAPEEWQAAYILSEKPLPKEPPRLNTVVHLITCLGGFLGRKG